MRTVSGLRRTADHVWDRRALDTKPPVRRPSDRREREPHTDWSVARRGHARIPRVRWPNAGLGDTFGIRTVLYPGHVHRGDVSDEVAAAGTETQQSRTRDQVVRDAIREGDRPDEDRVVAYAVDNGVPAEAARDLLEKLTRRGEVSESRGRYRLL